MGRHRADDETSTHPNPEQVKIAWVQNYPRDLLGTPAAPITGDMNAADLINTPITADDTLRRDIELCLNVLYPYMDTGSERSKVYIDVVDATTSGLPGSDTSPEQVIVTFPTDTGHLVTMIAALSLHPRYPDTYHIQVMLGESTPDDGAGDVMHHYIQSAFGIAPVYTALAWFINRVHRDPRPYLYGGGIGAPTLRGDKCPIPLPAVTRYHLVSQDGKAGLVYL